MVVFARIFALPGKGYTGVVRQKKKEEGENSQQKYKTKGIFLFIMKHVRALI